jgi:hypothetical protein
MGIVSGLVSSCTIDDASGTPQDVSSDVFSATIVTPRAQWDTSSIDVTGTKRQGLRTDATVTLNGGTDFGVGKIHAVMKADPAGTRTVTIVLANSAATFTAEMNRQDYGPALAQGGELTWTATLVNADGNTAAWT